VGVVWKCRGLPWLVRRGSSMTTDRQIDGAHRRGALNITSRADTGGSRAGEEGEEIADGEGVEKGRRWQGREPPGGGDMRFQKKRGKKKKEGKKETPARARDQRHGRSAAAAAAAAAATAAVAAAAAIRYSVCTSAHVRTCGVDVATRYTV